MDFETTLKELNTLVEEMERGGISLEDALKNFERGIHLTRNCQETLKTAEQKIQLLIEENGLQKLDVFDEGTDE